MQEFYTTIDSKATTTYKDRGSKFIAYVFPIENVDAFKIHLAEVKKEHPKATHYCFAYRLGVDNIIHRSSDDGEPPGTAGKPIMGQIDSKGLTNTLVIVVRYFGGTQLGIPGLIQAYKTASALVLQITPTKRLPVLRNYHLHFAYTQMNDIMHICKTHDVEIYSQEQNLFCDYKIGIPLVALDITLEKLNELESVEVREQ